MGEAAHRRWSDSEGAEPPSPTKAWYPSGCLGNTCVQVSTIRAPPQTCLSGICSSTGSRRSPRQHDAQEGPRLPRAEEKDAPIRSAFPRLTVEKNEKDTRAAQMKELLGKETQDSPALQGQPGPARTVPTHPAGSQQPDVLGWRETAREPLLWPRLASLGLSSWLPAGWPPS